MIGTACGSRVGPLLALRRASLAMLGSTCICLPAPASASPAVHLSTSLHPERLGHGTTISLRLRITGTGGRPPPPLTAADIFYAQEFGIALSGLGLEACSVATLETLGPAGCPPDSVMGYGSALGEIPFGPEVIHENASVTLLRAEDLQGHIALLLDAEGISPVKAHVVFPSVLLEAPRPFGGDIHMSVPLVASLPEGPDVSVGALSMTVGPEHLVYYDKRGGQTIPYVPKGILLPDRCPRGGFPFAARLAFQDGSHASARTSVRCPRRRTRTGRRRPR